MEQLREYRRGRYGLRIPLFFIRRHIGFSDESTLSPREEKELFKDSEAAVTVIKDLGKSSSRLSGLLDEEIFVAESLSFLTSRITGSAPQPIRELSPQDLYYDESNLACSTEEERRSITVREYHVHLTRPAFLWTLRSLASFLINMPPSPASRDFPEADTPEIFLRAFRKSCHSPHDKVLGFRSSGQPSTPPDYVACTLQDSSRLNADMLRNQCEGSDPSDLIAMSDSPARIFNIIKTWPFTDFGGEVIAVINSSKLIRMGVLFNRTTTLASHLGLSPRKTDPKRLSYANENYWVAYRWIPAECIERYLTISDLRKICEERGIGA